MGRRWRHPETIAIHSGYRSDDAGHAVSVPIYQTTSYEFQSTGQAEGIFALEEDGNTYSRLMNPTCGVLEARMTRAGVPLSSTHPVTLSGRGAEGFSSGSGSVRRQ